MQRNTLPPFGDRLAAFNALPWPRHDAAPRPRADILGDLAVIRAAQPLYCGDRDRARRLEAELQHEFARLIDAEFAAALREDDDG
jgi:hypothetical protein